TSRANVSLSFAYSTPTNFFYAPANDWGNNPALNIINATVEFVCAYLFGADRGYQITYVSSGSIGSLFTINSKKISAVQDLNSINNVSISSPSSDQLLLYNSVSGNWTNGNLPIQNS